MKQNKKYVFVCYTDYVIFYEIIFNECLILIMDFAYTLEFNSNIYMIELIREIPNLIPYAKVIKNKSYKIIKYDFNLRKRNYFKELNDINKTCNIKLKQEYFDESLVNIFEYDSNENFIKEVLKKEPPQ